MQGLLYLNLKENKFLLYKKENLCYTEINYTLKGGKYDKDRREFRF